MKIDHTAIVTIADQDQIRPAALVYRTPDGAAWVEPGYLFPEPSVTGGFHRTFGAITETADGFAVTTEAGRTVAFHQASRAYDDSEGTCMGALADWSDLLVEMGRSEAEEHASIAAELGDQLA